MQLYNAVLASGSFVCILLFIFGECTFFFKSCIIIIFIIKYLQILKISPFMSSGRKRSPS